MSGSFFKHICPFILLFLHTLSCTKQTDEVYRPQFSSTPISSKNKLIFAIHPLHNPQKLMEVFGPLVDYLNQHIDSVNFILEASRNYASFDKKLYAGKFHFALPNPYQTINSLKHNYRVFAKMGDDQNFRGIFIARKDKKLIQPRDLIGHAVSYPAPTALAATMMPQLYLQNHGVNVVKDLDNRYVGSQESSIMNVFLNNTIAGATWPPPWQAFKKARPDIAKHLYVIWETTPLVNNGLVVRRDVKDDLVTRVQKLIVNLHHTSLGSEILTRMGLSKFELATDATYQPVLDFVDRFDSQVRSIK